jgi:hypothetical protein
MHHSSRANKEILEQSNHKDISPHSPPFFFLPFLSQFSSPPFQGEVESKQARQASKTKRKGNQEKEKEITSKTQIQNPKIAKVTKKRVMIQSTPAFRSRSRSNDSFWSRALRKPSPQYLSIYLSMSD